jgi:diadenosine tetraphosphate (Ap4A) HIT family hydrolase
MNNAYQEEDPKPQVHFHVWPRYKDAVTFEGVTFTDEHFGHYIPGREVSQPNTLNENTFMKIREAIVAQLECY